MALYVYGLMRAQDGARAASESSAALEAISHDGIVALTAKVSDGNPSLRREAALSHSNILQDAFAHGPVLPMRFGTVLPDEAALERDLLGPRAKALRARLDALAGMAELQLKVSYAQEPLLRSVLASAPALADQAARIRGLPAEATHFERIRLGEAISATVQARRDADSRQLIDALDGLAVAVGVSELHHERGVLNASFLVAGERLEEFDAAVEELSEEHAELMQFRLIGPMPAYSFSERAWEAEGVAAERTQWG
jgi:hypothetical protein